MCSRHVIVIQMVVAKLCKSCNFVTMQIIPKISCPCSWLVYGGGRAHNSDGFVCLHQIQL